MASPIGLRAPRPDEAQTIADWHPVPVEEVLGCRGLGKQLVHALLPKAAATGMSTTFLRVTPDNDVAIGCYLACGFERLGPEESAVWNEGQKREWVWMLLG